jgi:hypothetical protein
MARHFFARARTAPVVAQQRRRQSFSSAGCSAAALWPFARVVWSGHGSGLASEYSFRGPDTSPSVASDQLSRASLRPGSRGQAPLAFCRRRDADKFRIVTCWRPSASKFLPCISASFLPVLASLSVYLLRPIHARKIATVSNPTFANPSQIIALQPLCNMLHDFAPPGQTVSRPPAPRILSADPSPAASPALLSVRGFALCAITLTLRTPASRQPPAQSRACHIQLRFATRAVSGQRR